MSGCPCWGCVEGYGGCSHPYKDYISKQQVKEVFTKIEKGLYPININTKPENHMKYILREAKKELGL